MAKKPPAPTKAPTRPKAEPKQDAPKKTFTAEPWTGEGEGEKIVMYGGSGMGKTTLAAMAPTPVFIAVDDGARKIRHPGTEEPLHSIRGIETFQDIRDALATPGLFDGFETIVVDTVTKVEELSQPYIFEHYKKDGQTVSSLEAYGWGKGFFHALDVMRCFLSDLERLMRDGKNVVLLAQESAARMPNSAGLDYLQSGPKLFHNNQCSSRLEVQEWADHVFRVAYAEQAVAGQSGDTKGKVVTHDTTRAVYTATAQHFVAKSRTLREPVISFEAPDDDSLWQYLFDSE